MKVMMLFVCEPFGSALCAVSTDLVIAWLPSLLGLFGKAVMVEWIMGLFLGGRREHWVLGIGKLPPMRHSQETHIQCRILHGFCSALPGQSLLSLVKQK